MNASIPHPPLTVLHPCHKLKYFKAAGWEAAWTSMAQELVRDTFNGSYATHHVPSVPDDESDSENQVYTLILHSNVPNIPLEWQACQKF